MEEVEFDGRMSDADALMWHIEQDPQLRSTIAVVWTLDRVPDRARLAEKIERATRLVPRLRQRVVSNSMSMAPPRWEVAPDFDLAFHLRWMRSPGTGTLRDLFDVAQPMAMQGFDRARPLWELAIVEGLEGDRAAVIMKIHHSLSDGVGLVRMTTSMIEGSRDPDDPLPMPDAPEVRVLGQAERFLDALDHVRRKQVDRVRRTWNALGEGTLGAARDPMGAARGVSDAVASVGRLLQPVSEPRSPVMRGRSLGLHFDYLSLSLDVAKAVARTADARLNDYFVAGVAGGLRRYHEGHGNRVPALRMSMPINLRDESSQNKAGNQFVPVRFDVPLDIDDPRERMRTIRDLVQQQRREPALPLVDEIASLMSRFPTAVSAAAFGTMLKGVDFITSNVPGPPFDVYLAGARVEKIVGFGPLSGAAVNLTLFSYNGELGVGINTDKAAVPDPDRLKAYLADEFDALARLQGS